MNDGYALLDFGEGLRLEQWGPYRLIRPDPTSTAAKRLPGLWDAADASYEGEKGKGAWVRKTAVPEQWDVRFGDVRMTVKLAPYKHTGVFPEQAENWSWTRAAAKRSARPLTILHLFAYTGGATVALAKDGHFVTHVDASKPALTWARTNAEMNAVLPDRVRWMLEDAPTFVVKERKRGKRYDAIILDPPVYGHGSAGKTWRVDRDLAPLLEGCAALLSDDPCFLMLNGYAHGDTPESFRRLLSGILLAAGRKGFSIDTIELLLDAGEGETLSTGIVARCAW